MSFKCGIVGLPNVGVVPVPDDRLKNLAKVSKSKKIINTTISFVDIAGLVKGASKGEGLGNKFLSHIREVDAIIHMIRCFDSNDIQNVNPEFKTKKKAEKQALKYGNNSKKGIGLGNKFNFYS